MARGRYRRRRRRRRRQNGWLVGVAFRRLLSAKSGAPPLGWRAKLDEQSVCSPLEWVPPVWLGLVGGFGWVLASDICAFHCRRRLARQLHPWAPFRLALLRVRWIRWAVRGQVEVWRRRRQLAGSRARTEAEAGRGEAEAKDAGGAAYDRSAATAAAGQAGCSSDLAPALSRRPSTDWRPEAAAAAAASLLPPRLCNRPQKCAGSKGARWPE